MTGASDFKRAVLGFSHDTTCAPALDVTVRLAELLGLDVVGLFFIDESLEDLLGYPNTREFVTSERGWRALDREKLRQEQEFAARTAERLFSVKAPPQKVKSTFRIVAGRTTSELTIETTGSDILVVVEPRTAAGFATQSFAVQLDSAIRSAAAVLLIPRSAQLRRGPVVAIADEPDDLSVRVASAIAAAAGERLIIVEAFAGVPGTSPPQAQPRAVPTETHSAGRGLRDDQSFILPLPGRLAESLIVCTRRAAAGADDKFATALAQLRRVPVLILEPAPRKSNG